MTVSQFEKAVWTVEKVRIVIRASKSAKVKDYSYKRADAKSHRVTEWLENRVAPRIGELTVAVIKGNGVIATRNTTMVTLRESYKKK